MKTMLLHPPPTTRLRFRTWTEADGGLAEELWTHPEVMRFMGGAMTAEGARERLRAEMARQREYGMQYWPIFLSEDERFAGCAGLRHFDADTRMIEMGVHIARPCWSLGLGEEAARAVMEFARVERGLRTLVAGHGPGNVNSQALIERLGFVYMQDVPWGPQQRMHPFYRLELRGNRDAARKAAIGLWQDRSDLPDTETLVRTLRNGAGRRERLKRSDD